MKVSKVLLAGMLLTQSIGMTVHAVDPETLKKAMAWVEEQQAKNKPATPPAPVQPIPQVQPQPVKPNPQVQPQPVKPVVVQPPPVQPQPQVQPTPQPQIPPYLQAGYQGPARTAGIKSEADNQNLFSAYCVGNASSAQVPQPNYASPEVRRAAQIMSKVADLNIYYYGDLKRLYKDGAPKSAAANMFPQYASAINSYTDNAHLFLVQTCGEFRDRAEMVQGKIRWVNNMVFLGSNPQQPINPKASNVWAQVSGHSYTPYLAVSAGVYYARRAQAAADTYLQQNLHPDAQKPAQGATVCETKYILSEYVAKGRAFDDLSTFENGYKYFESQCGVDAQGRDDRDYYYDFRGDSNFKQYSPESNAMIWQAISIARFCDTPTKSNGKSAVITDQVCENYFRKPFMTRYNAARSGLGAWLLYTPSQEDGFQNQNLNVTVFPSFDLKNLGVMPFSMKLSDGTLAQSQLNMKDGTLGFNDMFRIGSSQADLSSAFKRLRNAVNRHTNWYDSSFDDQLGHEKSVRAQAYSPFVASSYEMSASNGFTECGTTVQCQGDGRKAWMLVFKVHKNNWYNTENLMKNQKIDFDKMWFDETTFGTDGLADNERAWDRMGTALETELDTILYLHNLQAGSGVPVANDGLN
jgi:hypothetical protein